MKRMLYPGSFDPVTRGHMDIIRRSANLCDELIVAVMHNPDKRGAFPVSDRVRLLERACEGIKNVRVIAHGGLLITCAKENEVTCVIRGVRPLGDFETEFSMAQINRMLGGVETLMMATSSDVAGVSSSIVRQVASFGGNIDSMVPEGLAGEISACLMGKQG